MPLTATMMFWCLFRRSECCVDPNPALCCLKCLYKNCPGPVGFLLGFLPRKYLETAASGSLYLPELLLSDHGLTAFSSVRFFGVATLLQASLALYMSVCSAISVKDAMRVCPPVVPFVVCKMRIWSDLECRRKDASVCSARENPNRPITPGERREQSGLLNGFCLHPGGLLEIPPIPQTIKALQMPRSPVPVSEHDYAKDERLTKNSSLFLGGLLMRAIPGLSRLLLARENFLRIIVLHRTTW
jgi:hypothetical protein